MSIEALEKFIRVETVNLKGLSNEELLAALQASEAAAAALEAEGAEEDELRMAVDSHSQYLDEVALRVQIILKRALDEITTNFNGIRPANVVSFEDGKLSLVIALERCHSGVYGSLRRQFPAQFPGIRSKFSIPGRSDLMDALPDDDPYYEAQLEVEIPVSELPALLAKKNGENVVIDKSTGPAAMDVVGS